MKFEFKFVPVDCSTGRPILPVGVTSMPVVATVDLDALATAFRDCEKPPAVSMLAISFAQMFAEKFCADVYYRRVYDTAERFEGQGVDENWTRQRAIYEREAAATA